jgi:hypothetical protein
MEYVTLKAATAAVATDQGVFEAVISSEAVDRERDIVAADAMVSALKKMEPADPACVGALHRGGGRHRPARRPVGPGGGPRGRCRRRG